MINIIVDIIKGSRGGGEGKKEWKEGYMDDIYGSEGSKRSEKECKERLWGQGLLHN